jgi:hypothetical protein
MPIKPSGPIRRGQLIAPFGVGAMITVPGGTSMIISGLDFWYKNRDGSDINDPEEFKFEEWRLQELLQVSHFRLPPDYRDSKSPGKDALNLQITIPAFRFPTWHFCPDCKLLKEWPMVKRGRGGRIKCPKCEDKNKTRYMFQVPFVAMCELGHIQDFPWREWVHSSLNSLCQGDLRLIATGSATLAGQKVKCDECGKERNLVGITTSKTSSSGKTITTLSKSLSPDEEFLCRGLKPWLGQNCSEPCNAPVKGSLRSASNVYFAQIRSSIYLPRVEDRRLQELEDLLSNPPISTYSNQLIGLGVKLNKVSESVKASYPRPLANYTIVQITTILEIFQSKQAAAIEDQATKPSVRLDEDEQTAFRRNEYEGLKKDRDDLLLKITSGDLRAYTPLVRNFFSRIMLVDKLQETRALAGFTRVYPENDLNAYQRQQKLVKTPISAIEGNWLPAYKVYGEGIFFEFDEEKIKIWENKAEGRVKPLVDRYQQLQVNRRLRERKITPRFILIHTFAHLIMNRLTFECGYSSAALRERLYVSSNPISPMAGVLIYTADGDSEGTMGGLVRMGKPGYIEPVIQRALENAAWCSADPVCMEMGKHMGQGPDSCNLAACHNCALVPETACEEFNRFLDRAVVIGGIDNHELGFFEEVI